jgi:DUF1365 family protein
MAYLDLEEIPGLVRERRLVAERRWSRPVFLREDHLFQAGRPLQAEIREMIRQRTGQEARGPIRLLTQLRHWGYYFSPLNLFYAFDPAGERVDFVVAEVNNTPWNERHCYVLWDGNGSASGRVRRHVHEKQFHVSPFMGMDMEYRWRLSAPADRLTVRVTNMQHAQRLFQASLVLRRCELTAARLRRQRCRYPWMTAQVIAAIYFEAWRLWWKQCPYFPHPKSEPA